MQPDPSFKRHHSGDMLQTRPYKTSLLKIITIDHIAAFATQVITMMLGYYLFFRISLIIIDIVRHIGDLEQYVGDNLLIWITRLIAPFELVVALIFLGLSLPALLVLIWRVWLIRRVFAEGVETTARISSVGHTNEDCIVEYTYPYQGIVYWNENKLQRGKQPSWLAGGGQAVVMVDPRKPARAFLRDLYLG